MIEKQYKCDLCRVPLSAEFDESATAFGIGFGGNPPGWVLRDANEVGHHLCSNCIASIQAMKKICRHGYQCGGGLSCGSDHK